MRVLQLKEGANNQCKKTIAWFCRILLQEGELIKDGKEPVADEREAPKRFISVAAAEKIEEMKKRELLLEKGFDSNLESLPHMLVVTIVNQNWQKLCSKSEPAVASIVREFYTNLKDNEIWTTKVRGQQVTWSPTIINEYYDIPDFPFAIFNAMELAPSHDRSRPL